MVQFLSVAGKGSHVNELNLMWMEIVYTIHSAFVNIWWMIIDGFLCVCIAFNDEQNTYDLKTIWKMSILFSFRFVALCILYMKQPF